ncbi:hypothetical protein B0H17DRAFT_1130459 [Mycena rosella]|uniref:Uncharacterized protein n=1 Tax=Mycena rosella TaxID=1033263 RepID=A0AAD7DSL6_MYCRO|nr:hypothetical protein B0H17DRAFT_1130459 [Mycena rosella]
MYAPAQRVAVLVDIIFPGWVPFTELGVADFLPGLIAVHDVLLRFDFDVLVAGHVAQLSTQHDVLQQKKYIEDLRDSCASVLNGDRTDGIGPTAAVSPGNVWAMPKALFRIAAQICADNTTSRWLGILGAVDVFAFENAYRMVNLLLIEYNVPGPFSVA